MKPSIAAALLSLGLGPLAAHAQAAEAPTAVVPVAATTATPPAAAVPALPPAAEPVGPWSIGAGVGWSSVGGQYYLLGGSTAYVQSPAPSVRTSLERAVAPGWWVELGFTGSANRMRGEVPADASGITTRADQVSSALNLGVRRAITRPGAPVLVSVDLSVFGGYLASHTDWTSGTPQTLRGESWQVGVATGLAVERELTSGLSLRVGTALLEASWTGSTVESSSGTVTRKGGGATLALSPWLELRQAF